MPSPAFFKANSKVRHTNRSYCQVVCANRFVFRLSFRVNNPPKVGSCCKACVLWQFYRVSRGAQTFRPSLIHRRYVCKPAGADAGDISYHRHEPRQAPRRWRRPKTVWGLPSFLADAYAHHDVGRVIFNHLPPQIRNPYGDLNAYPKSTDWAHVFRAIG